MEGLRAANVGGGKRGGNLKGLGFMRGGGEVFEVDVGEAKGL